jgi:hypothetical protein
LLNAFANRIAIDEYTGASNVAPASAPESAWKEVGGLSPAVLWRPLYRDDYFDAGRDVTTRAIRLRVVEPWVNENPDFVNRSKGKPTCAGLGGLVVLKHGGNDPPFNEIPAQRISIADIATGAWERHVAVPEPSWPTFDPQGRLLLVSQQRVVRFDLATGATAPVLPAGALKDPRGLAFDAQGNLYVADGGPEVVQVFAANGKLLRTIGEPGGREVGDYNPNRIENPQGIAIDARGNLWVAERDFQPKRTSVWSPKGAFLKEFIGHSEYGGGGQVDPRDPSRIYCAGMEFSLNYTSGQWDVKRILSREVQFYGGDARFEAKGQAAFSLTTQAAGLPDKPIYLNGRQYMVGDPGGMRAPLLRIGEFRKDRIVPLTVMGNADSWWPLVHDPALRQLVADRVLKTLSFTWSDQNGDGLPQPGEVEIYDFRLDPTYWPTVTNARLELQMGGRALKPVAFTACGAPVYQPQAATPLAPRSWGYATAVDQDGRILINSDPLTGLDADGQIRWTYPNPFHGVHGSQRSPAPQAGILAGPLGFIGQEVLPGVGEVFMLSGNCGEWYLFTADGLLAATVWNDSRTPGVFQWDFPKAELGMSLDNVALNGECFFGSFQRADNGTFYLVAGKEHSSVVELNGLETMKRQQSTLTVTKDDRLAVEAWAARRALTVAQKAPPKEVTLVPPAAPIKPDGNLAEWGDAGQSTAIGTRGAFAVRADDQNLYVAWQVDSGQPLRNAGNIPNQLFKSGDSVDLQIGVNPEADPKRGGPFPGDQRLLISLYEGKPIGVLYRHRVPGTKETDKIGFSSPSRTEYVDVIDRLDPANIGIGRTPKGYAVEAVVPLTLLGVKPQPGKSYKIDFGILSADSSGQSTMVRTYWANQNTGIVSDVPSEIMLAPGLWGNAQFK